MHVLSHTGIPGPFPRLSGDQKELAPTGSPGPQGNYRNCRAGDEETELNSPASATPSITTRGTEAAARGVRVKGPHAVPGGLATCRGRRQQADGTGRRVQQPWGACWGRAGMKMSVNSSSTLSEDGTTLSENQPSLSASKSTSPSSTWGTGLQMRRGDLLHPKSSPGAWSPPHGIAKGVRGPPQPCWERPSAPLPANAELAV